MNASLLTDSIDIMEETRVKVSTGWKDDCVELALWVPASLWCGEGNIDIFQCLPKKRTSRDICIEVWPDINLACKKLLVRVYRAGCDIWVYRIHDVMPQVFIKTGLDSYYMIWSLIDD